MMHLMNAPNNARIDEAKIFHRSPIFSIIHVEVRLNGIPARVAAARKKSTPETVVSKQAAAWVVTGEKLRTVFSILIAVTCGQEWTYLSQLAFTKMFRDAAAAQTHHRERQVRQPVSFPISPFQIVSCLLLRNVMYLQKLRNCLASYFPDKPDDQLHGFELQRCSLTWDVSLFLQVDAR